MKKLQVWEAQRKSMFKTRHKCLLMGKYYPGKTPPLSFWKYISIIRVFRKKQRVPVLHTYPGKQRMSPTEIKHQRFLRTKAVLNTYQTAKEVSEYHQLYERFRLCLKEKNKKQKNKKTGWSDIFRNMSEKDVHRLLKTDA
jgi:hypothetical protein